jgi:hypothetical protein
VSPVAAALEPQDRLASPEALVNARRDVAKGSGA